MCLTNHPDRVAGTRKMIATEKFKIISKIHAVLMDEQARTLYDETESMIKKTSFTITNIQLNRAVAKYAGE